MRGVLVCWFAAVLASPLALALRLAGGRPAPAVHRRTRLRGSKEVASKVWSSPSEAAPEVEEDQGYGAFAKKRPFFNNVLIATTKTLLADLLAQTVIGGASLAELDLERSLLFMSFGAIYLGGFQYLYQVNIFKRLFDVDKFTSQSWAEKLEDKEGLGNLAKQTALDLAVLTWVYLPTFYVFKAAVAGLDGGAPDPAAWTDAGLATYQANFAKDEVDLLRVWFPADLVCFSVPLYLRLPSRHVVSFVWTAYLSFARGGH